MNIHEKLKEVQDYFKEKLLNGEYEVNGFEYGDSVVAISIEKHHFDVWCDSIFSYEFKIGGIYNTVIIPLTLEEQNVLWDKFHKIRAELRNGIKEESERKEWERLNPIYGTTKN